MLKLNVDIYYLGYVGKLSAVSYSLNFGGDYEITMGSLHIAT